MLTRRSLLAAAPAPALPRTPRGQMVFLHAWAGDGAVNAFIAWASERMTMLHGIRVRHVRLPDTAAALRLAQGHAALEPLDAVLACDAPRSVAPGSLVLPFRERPAWGVIVIPADAPHRAGALLLARFLLSQEAQARAALGC